MNYSYNEKHNYFLVFLANTSIRSCYENDHSLMDVFAFPVF